MKRLRYLSSLVFGTVMLLAGLLVWFGLRHQDIHATPPAILLAVVLAAIVSALLGWCLVSVYVARRRVAAILFVPVVILVVAAFTAGTTYVLATPAFRGAPFINFISAQAHYVPSYAVWYVSAGSFVWVPGFILATLFLTRVAARETHS